MTLGCTLRGFLTRETPCTPLPVPADYADPCQGCGFLAGTGIGHRKVTRGLPVPITTRAGTPLASGNRFRFDTRLDIVQIPSRVMNLSTGWVQSLSRMLMAIIRDYSEVHSTAARHSHCEQHTESPGHMTSRHNSHRNHAVTSNSEILWKAQKKDKCKHLELDSEIVLVRGQRAFLQVSVSGLP